MQVMQLLATLFAIVFLMPTMFIELYADTGKPKYLLYAIAELAIFAGVIWLIWL